MEDQKKWYESRGVIGAAVAVVASLASAFGLADISGENQEAIVQGVLGFTGAVAGLVAVWGRVRASSKIER